MRRLPRKPGPMKDPALGNALAGVNGNPTPWRTRPSEADRPQPGNPNWLVDMTQPLHGVKIVGGCEHCDAYVRLRPEAPHVRLVIHHDTGCPALAAR